MVPNPFSSSEEEIGDDQMQLDGSGEMKINTEKKKKDHQLRYKAQAHGGSIMQCDGAFEGSLAMPKLLGTIRDDLQWHVIDHLKL